MKQIRTAENGGLAGTSTQKVQVLLDAVHEVSVVCSLEVPTATCTSKKLA